jgi:hypothetical protein
VSGLQLASMQRLFLQSLPAAHIMQSSDRPHPSPMTPQYFPPPPVPASGTGTLHVSGLQLGPPTQTLFSQVQSAPRGAQSPHLRIPPQLSPMSPQYRPPVAAHVMRHGGRPTSVVIPPSVGPGGNPPAPEEPPVGAMVPPAPPAPAVPAPADPPAPELPALARTGGSSDEQLNGMAKTAAHSQATPRHWRHRIVMSSNLPLQSTPGGYTQTSHSHTPKSDLTTARHRLRLLWNPRGERPASRPGGVACP